MLLVKAGTDKVVVSILITSKVHTTNKLMKTKPTVHIQIQYTDLTYDSVTYVVVKTRLCELMKLVLFHLELPIKTGLKCTVSLWITWLNSFTSLGEYDHNLCSYTRLIRLPNFRLCCSCCSQMQRICLSCLITITVESYLCRPHSYSHLVITATLILAQTKPWSVSR